MSAFTPSTLPPELIERILPAPSLNNINTGQIDIENDINYLLSWLSPFYPTDEMNLSEPSLRLKSAMRSCLKGVRGQLDFVKRYINTVNQNFRLDLKDGEVSFLNIIEQIRKLKDYYDWHIAHLNLSLLPKDLFNRNLDSLFRNALIDKSDFLSKLKSYLEVQIFGKEGYSQVELQKVLTVLVSVDFTSEVNSVFIKLSISKIRGFILHTCSKVWNKPLLHSIQNYIDKELWPNFVILMKLSGHDHVLPCELVKIAYDELVFLRTREIYDIVFDYPNSEVCLFELYQCLTYPISQNDSKSPSKLWSGTSDNHAFQRTKFVDTFIELCEDFLLHSGTNTVDVVTMYTRTIKSFLIIDPKGVLLDKVIRPIRRYLKTRDDIITRLVEGLLDESDSNPLIELANELREGSDRRNNVIVRDNVDLDWVPDPIDALPDFKKGGVADVIESLTSIFDSKDIFIGEFTKHFGNKLIDLHNYDVTEIVDSLELLKQRFGRDDFVTLDIMIRDVKESKVMNELVSSEIQIDPSPSFHSTILSHNYWNQLMDSISVDIDNFRLPPVVDKHFNEYSRHFRKNKKGRYLKLLPHLGFVKLNLTLNGEQIPFEVSTDKASIIYLFNDNQEPMSSGSVAEKLRMTPYVASQGLQFWVKQGVLKEFSPGIFITNEDDDEDNVLG